MAGGSRLEKRSLSHHNGLSALSLHVLVFLFQLSDAWSDAPALEQRLQSMTLRAVMLNLAGSLDGRAPAEVANPASLWVDLLLGAAPPPPPFASADADPGGSATSGWLATRHYTTASALHPDDLPTPSTIAPAAAPPRRPDNGIARVATAAPVLGEEMRSLFGPVAARHSLAGPVCAAPDPDLGVLAGRLLALTTPAPPAAVPVLADVLTARTAQAVPDAVASIRAVLARRGTALALSGARGGGSPRRRAAALLAAEVGPSWLTGDLKARLGNGPIHRLATISLAGLADDAHAALEAAARAARARVARARMATLRASDINAYLRLAREAASDRIEGLLAETDGVLRSLGERLGVDLAVEEGPAAAPAASVPSTTATDALVTSAAAWASLAVRLGAAGLDAQPALLAGGSLRPYQMDGLRWMVGLAEKGVNGVLADEMGLGKTAQSISAFCALKERAAAARAPCGPFLVVAPSSLLTNWAREVAAWAPSLAVALYRGPPADRAAVWSSSIKPRARGGPCRNADVVVTSYEFAMAADDARRLGSVHWRLVVVDEGHRLKNAASKLTTALNGYRAGGRFLLTGTPLQNRLSELWALLNFLMPAAFPSAAEFDAWFGGSLGGGGGGGGAGGRAAAVGAEDADADDASLLDEETRLLVTSRLHQVLRPFFLRRLKADVAGELPAKEERVITVPPTPYQAALNFLVRAGLEGRGAPGATRGVANAVMELRTISNHPFLSRYHQDGTESLLLSAGGGGQAGSSGVVAAAAASTHPLHATLRACGKLEVVDRLLLFLHAAGRRALVFATMTRALDVIETALNRRGLPFERLDGNTPGPERDAAVARFNDPAPGPFAFLLSVRAGGVGLNLQAADTVIMYDTDWNPAVDAQAQGRAHRIGQAKAVLVFRLRTAGSIEERVQSSAAGKQAAADASITGGFFDGRTSEAARRDYLVGLLRGGGGGNGGGGGPSSPPAATLPLSDADLIALLARPGAPAGESALLTAAAARRAAAEAAAVGGGSFARLLTVAEAAPLVRTATLAAAPRAVTPLDQLGRGMCAPVAEVTRHSF